MEKIVFADEQQSYFARFGLKSFDDFYNYQANQAILKTSKRYVNCITLGAKSFFIKRFRYAHLNDLIFGLSNFGYFHSQAKIEWKNANLLINKGFATYKPVCFGERKIFGIETKSFFVTEKLRGQPLTEFVVQNFLKLDRAEKEKIIISLAWEIRRLHDVGISMPDLYIWHVFIEKKESGDYEFAIIDLHRMKHKNSLNECIGNLARFDYSLREEYFNDKLRRLFIESYAGNDWKGDIDTFFNKVKKQSAILSSKRNIKPYLIDQSAT